MKLVQKILASSLLVSSVFSADSPIQLPSSVPLDVFTIEKDQIGLGYITFNVKLELEDDYYDDKIGDVTFDTKGIIYTKYASKNYPFIGHMFEKSYTAGTISSELKDNIFVDKGVSYNNSYDKSGFYMGIRPSFSRDIYESNSFYLKHTTSLHTIFYTISGDYTVDSNKTSAISHYGYDETDYGIGLKPSTVIQATYKIDRLRLSLYAGASTFLALDWSNWENKANSDDWDSELEFIAADVTPLYGWDISYKFTNDSTFNLSTAISQEKSDNSSETIMRYVFNF